MFIYGDYKYGEDALDKDLWGDADIIHAGDDFGESYYIEISAGDGDDIVYGGENWYGSTIRGENGNDTIHVPTGIEYLYVYGNDGDDTIKRTATYGEVDYGDVEPNYYEAIFGGDGNDFIEGGHRIEDYGYLYGGDGDDKLYGGDYNAVPMISGGDGDDWIVGGDYAQDDEYIYGDSTDFEAYWDYRVAYGDADLRYMINDRGDDVVYGGDYIQGDSFINGGYGDDKLIGGHDIVGDVVKIYGDHGFYGVPVSLDIDHPAYGMTETEVNRYGLPDDGDDLIDLGDSPSIGSSIFAFGQGGNDKVIGGLA